MNSASDKNGVLTFVSSVQGTGGSPAVQVFVLLKSTQLLASVGLCGDNSLCYDLRCTKWILTESRIGCYIGLEGSLNYIISLLSKV